MEQYIKNNNVSDITYPDGSNFLGITSGSRSYTSKRNFIRGLSELILDIEDVKDLIRRRLRLRFTSLTLRKSSAH